MNIDEQFFIAPHQQRVIDERKALDEKRAALAAFFGTPVYKTLPHSEKMRLSEQYGHMTAYSDVLGRRIAHFP